MAGPQFIKYFPYVISALKELGNSGTPAEVRQLIAEKLNLSDEELNQQISSGTSRFENQVAWAKFYLSKAGYIDASKRGVWTLTELGVNTSITDKEAVKIFKEVRQQFKDKTDSEESHDFEDQSAPSDSGLLGLADYRTELLETIRSLSPAGFERLCQRLLRESGFQQVEVTGRYQYSGHRAEPVYSAHRAKSRKMYSKNLNLMVGFHTKNVHDVLNTDR